MILKNDYRNCLTNVACSIQKYFGVAYQHPGQSDLDEVLERRQPKNVIVMLFDGLGDNTLQKALTRDDFFLQHRKTRITSIFPATTTAATTTIESGLNPCEHGWLGWNTYLSGIDQVCCLFLEKVKGTNENCTEAVQKERGYIPIVQQINDAHQYQAHNVSEFGDIKYRDLADMEEKIVQICQQPGKKYLYVYNNEPDHLMHDLGPDAPEVYQLIQERNDVCQHLASRLEDTVMVILADHGHTIVNNIHLEDYPDLFSLLDRKTSIEPRACSFKIKPGQQEKFKTLFQHYFQNQMELLSREEILKMQLFGDGKMHEGFVESLGDFIAVAVNSQASLVTNDDWCMYSHHAGYSDDEVYVPLIIVER